MISDLRRELFRLPKTGIFWLVIEFYLCWSMPVFSGQQGNFQIAIPPIPYPEFAPNQFDSKITGSYLSINTGSGDAAINISGGGVNGTFRKSIDAETAIDLSIGFFKMDGRIPNSVTLNTTDTNNFFYHDNIRGGTVTAYPNVKIYSITTDRASLSGYQYAMGIDLEAKLLDDSGKSLLIFVGPHSTLTSQIINTPFNIIESGTILANEPGTSPTIYPWNYTHTGWNYTTKSDIYLAGGRIGAQGSISLSSRELEYLKLVPYIMATVQGGYSSIYNGPEIRGLGPSGLVSIPDSNTTVSVPSVTTISYGMDIIFVPWNLSIGSLLQQTFSSGFNQSVLISMSWHFQKS